MIRTILIYGAIAGLIVGGFTVGGMVLWPSEEPPEGGALVGYLVMIAALTAVFLGIKSYRDKTLGGVIKFLPALLVGLGISAVASLGWVIGWEIALAVTNFDFSEAMMKATMAQIEQERAKGVAEAVLQKKIADTQAFLEVYVNNPLVRMAVSFVEMFPIGLLISLISAALLRNSRFLPARPAST